MRPLLVALLLFAGPVTRALDVTLHINKDTTTVFGLPITGCSFNATPQFATKSILLHLAVGEPLNATVVNHDTLPHTFTIDGVLETANTVAPGATEVFNLAFPAAGSYRYYSEVPYGAPLGAGGIVLVGYQGHPRFFWDLFDLQADLTFDLASGQATGIPPDYQPELFFINGTHAPNTFNDTDTYVAVQLGDTAIISIANGGNMDHVLHFHGFHVEILDARIQSERAGWSKETFPVKRGEAMTVRLVADQAGIYPVHDHNLIAVTNAGFYPGGMLTQINVSP